MSFYIQIENGQPINNPLAEENLLQAFGSIPSNYVPFTKILFETTNLTVDIYQKAVSTYVLDNDGISWKDDWSIVNMTDEEKAIAIEIKKSNPPCPNVLLDIETLKWKPSIQKPQDNNEYYWDWKSGAWILSDINN